MTELGFRSLALLVLPALLLGCDAGKECEPIACQSGVWAVAEPSGAWKEGDYELEVTHDGETDKCTFSLPYAIPTANVTVYLDCGESLRVSLAADSSCTECTIDDPFQLGVFVDGLPTDLSIQLTHADAIVLTDTRTVEYEDVFPRGEECGGGCTQSKYELAVEFPE
jgi:hypothetical protein